MSDEQFISVVFSVILFGVAAGALISLVCTMVILVRSGIRWAWRKIMNAPPGTVD